MEKYQIGSYMLGLSNNHDYDYLIIGDKFKRYRDDSGDCLVLTPQQLENDLYFKSTTMMFCIFNYQLDCHINPAFTYCKYNILDYQDELKKVVSDIINEHQLGFSKDIGNANCCIRKNVYHIAYNIYILKNKSTTLTSTQKKNIQKIHDGIMPLSFIDELVEEFNNL